MGVTQGFACDHCEKRVEPVDAHGWLSVVTLTHAEARVPVRPLSGTFCSLECLADWADDRGEEDPDDQLRALGLLPVEDGPPPLPRTFGNYL